jgi:hypothetical protein
VIALQPTEQPRQQKGGCNGHRHECEQSGQRGEPRAVPNTKDYEEQEGGADADEVLYDAPSEEDVICRRVRRAPPAACDVAREYPPA